MKIDGVLLGGLIFYASNLIPMGLPSGVPFGVNNAWGQAVPLPVKKQYTINSAAPLATIWNTLSSREKALAAHLQNAARYGRDLLFIQSHRHALVIKETFEAALNEVNFEKTRSFFLEEGEAAFQELLLYAAQFEDQGGPYGTSNRKYILRKVTPAQVATLFKKYAPQTAGEGLTQGDLESIVRLLTDPEYEVMRRPEGPDASELSMTGGNLYQKGLSGAEVQSALARGLKIDLNCQVLKNAEGELYCRKMTRSTPGPIGDALTRTVDELKAAIPFASTEHQKHQIESTIQYFIEGKQEDFREASIEWVKDRTHSRVDFMMGFVEVYDDYFGNIGTWESYVQVVDPETTRASELLAKSAQYFEDQMPYGIWRKKFPENYSPPALMAYYFQEIAGMRSGGYNLPNFDDIRRDIGFKNIIRLPLPGDGQDLEKKAILREAYRELGLNDRVDHLLQHQAKARLVLVLLHEIIGHGSGIYDPELYGPEEDPISALASSGGSALEEQRADLAALVFAADPKLVEVGIYQSPEEGLVVRNAMYDLYLIDFMRWMGRERTFSEAHLRGHWLLVKMLMDSGAVVWADPQLKPGEGETLSLDTQVLVVKDYDRFRKVCVDLLSTLQDIKANRKALELETLFREHAPLSAIDLPWAQAIVSRAAGLRINAGAYEQSWQIQDDLTFVARGDLSLEGLAKTWQSSSR